MNRYQVYTPDGEFVGTFATLEEARLAAEQYVLPRFPKIVDTTTMEYVE
jgi:hypothetical protein